MLLPGMEGKEEVHTLVLCSAASCGARGTRDTQLGVVPVQLGIEPPVHSPGAEGAAGSLTLCES